MYIYLYFACIHLDFFITFCHDAPPTTPIMFLPSLWSWSTSHSPYPTTPIISPLAFGLGPPPTPRRDSLFARKEALLNVFEGSDIDEWIPRTRRTSTTVMPAGKVGSPSAPPSIATLLADEQEGTGGMNKHHCDHFFCVVIMNLHVGH